VVSPRKRYLDRCANQGRVGPDGPELTCDECFERLDRYVELELAEGSADEEIPDMRAHT
jgi:hypothetical protein